MGKYEGRDQEEKEDTFDDFTFEDDLTTVDGNSSTIDEDRIDIDGIDVDDLYCSIVTPTLTFDDLAKFGAKQDSEMDWLVQESMQNSSHASLSWLANMILISSFEDADASAKSLAESVGIPTSYFGTSSEQLKKQMATNKEMTNKDIARNMHS